MKNIVLIISIFTFSHVIEAQIPYKAAIGVRVGGTQGLTIKLPVGNSAAFEGIIGMYPFGMSITGLYEKHNSTNTSGLQWYYGGGVHAGWNTYNNYYYRKDRKYFYNGRDNYFGIDGIIGLEYKVSNAPIAFSLDLKPEINFYNSGYSALYLDPGLGIKFAF